MILLQIDLIAESLLKDAVLTVGVNLRTLLTAEIIKWQKCARMGLNGFHIKCIIGTHCN